MVEIPPDVVELLESGASTWAATSDGAGLPEVARVVGTRVRAKGLTIYFPNEQLGRTLHNLEKTGEVAVFYATMSNYLALQVKGEVVAVRESRAADRKLQEAYKEKFVDLAVTVGVPRALISRHAYWPSTAVDLAVRELLVQTPGPQAGTPWR